MEKFLEYIYVNKELHFVIFKPICDKYDITLTEVLVLMYLDKNTSNDTAKDIVSCLKIAKSYVSTSIRDLEERGYIEGNYVGHDHRAIHLKLCESAHSIIEDIHKVKKEMASVIFDGFSIEEKQQFTTYIERMTNNANEYINSTKKEGKS